MVSAVSTEVYLYAVPQLVIFVLLVLPVPLLSALVSKAVLALQQLKIGPVPVLVALPLLMVFTFAQSLVSYNQKYGEVKTDFSKEIFRVEYLHKRAIHERNLYIHVLCAVLGFAILKIAALTLRVKQQDAERLAEKKSA